MLKEINGLPVVPFQDADKLWYSFIKAQVAEVDFGCVDVKFTIKSGKICAIKVIRENTLNIHNFT